MRRGAARRGSSGCSRNETPVSADPSGSGRAVDLPQRFGAYRVEALIGAGGMGVVYRASDEALQRQVALKTLLPALAADPEFVARFKREAQSAAALNHPNITQIYAIGQEGTIPFFAMELLGGPSLEGLLKEKGPLDAHQAATYILQAAMGLRHAAQKQLIHRDIKPSNLMLAEDGSVKITDFGLAKAAKAETQLTATGEVLGSPGYISPEQAQGGTLDARSDIYSLGATFYHLITGRLPFDAPTPVAMIIKHMSEPLRSPRALNAAIPYPIAACIQKMMAKRPSERFQDHDALIRELERAMAAQAPAGAASPSPGAVVASGGRTWSGMTGIEARPARGRNPARPATPVAGTSTGGRSIFPYLLYGGVGLAIVLFLLQRHTTAPAEPAVAAPLSAASAPGGSATGSSGGIEMEGSFTTRPSESQRTFTSRPGIPGAASESGAGSLLGDRLRQRLTQRGRANLTIIAKDHQVLPDGRLQYFGQVKNVGGSVATHARIRIQIMNESGAFAAQAEVPLSPSVIPPEITASFDLPIDYTGTVGTIRAELVWDE